MYCDYIGDLLSLVVGAIIVYRIAKKGRQSIKPSSFLSLCIGCLMVILPVIAMLIGKYHGICAILFGIVFFIFTYRDKNKPSPGLTIDYSWHLGGYEAGIIAICVWISSMSFIVDCFFNEDDSDEWAAHKSLEGGLNNDC